MRKVLPILAVILMLGSCSKDDGEINGFSEHEKSVLEAIQGTFYGEYSINNGTTVYRTEEITFTPYSEPKEIVSLFGTFKACGYAIIDEVYIYTGVETHSVCYLVISTPVYDGQVQTVSFYEYNTASGEVTDKEDKRILTIVDNSTIKLRAYGSAENNDIIFTKR